MNDLAKPRARSAKVKEAKPAASQTARPGGSAKAEVNALPADTIAAFDGDADFVASLARGLAVLLAFSQQSRRMTIAQVSHRTGLPRAAVRRSLHTLAQLGYVASDDARGFSLRPKVLALGNAYLASTPLALAAQPVLDRLSDRLQESCSLGILDGDEMVYLARSTCGMSASKRRSG